MSKYLLAFDTSSNDIVLQLASFSYDEPKLLSVIAKTHAAPRAANTQLLTHIDAALNQAGVTRRELGAVAVGITLGSYTGVRIGVATAKGIAQALGIPLYGLLVDEEKLSPDHLLECFEQSYVHQTGDPSTVLPNYTQLSYAEEAEKETHPARYAKGVQSQQESAPAKQLNCSHEPGGGSVSARALIPHDLDALFELANNTACFKWSKQQYADELQSAASLWLGAFAPDARGRQQLIAYIGANAAVAEVDLLQLATHQDFRGQGIARALFERLLKQLQERKSASLSLEVRASNKPARMLYKRLGFEQLAVREKYYRAPNEDALVMKLTLDKSLIEGHLLLGIETSCDETAVAVMQGTRLISNIVASQVVFHARFGGVVPEIASRKHSEAIVATVDMAMEEAGKSLPFSALTGVAVTDKPGLIGALVVGQAYAKGLAWALDKPLYGINHLEGHLYACVIDDSENLPSPFVALIVSGGHTMLVYSPKPHIYESLGETLDDAAGEAFDKVAKVLGLGYPGGPILSKLAESGNPHAIEFPRAMMHSKDYSFSLSGLKTAVITYIREAEEKDQTLNIPDVAASFQQAVVDVQVAKALRAVQEKQARHFIMAGGVAANKVLREALVEALAAEGAETHIPPFKYCGDNAAMIVRTAIARLEANRQVQTAGDDNDNDSYLKPLPLSADCSSSAQL